MSGSMSFDNLSSLMSTSTSFSDLNSELNPTRGRNINTTAGGGQAQGKSDESRESQEELRQLCFVSRFSCK